MPENWPKRTGIAPDETPASDSDAGGVLVLATARSAQVSLTPRRAPKQAGRKEGTPKEKKARRRRSAAAASDAEAGADANAGPAPTPRRRPTPAFEDPNVDLVYGAYQRGMYKTAFDLAMTRAQYNGDPKAMTMLGELYANAMGVKRDYAKAAEWYKRAADAGDREGMFALAMMRLSGRGGAANREEAVKLLASVRQTRQPQGGL